MADRRSIEIGHFSDSLYIEELNANDGASQRIADIKTTDTVEALKRCIASTLRSPLSWSSIEVAFAGQELNNCKASAEPSWRKS